MGSNERKRRRFYRQAIAISIGALLVVGVVFYANSVNVPATHLKAWFELPNGKKSSKFWLEIASTEGERSKGLMFRKTLPDDEGMIFIYSQEQRQVFWMKNTFIPLDMIFVNKDLRVVGVLHDVPVQSESQRSVEQPSQYVVELIAGSAKKHHIQEGALLRISGDMPKAQ